VRNPVERQSRRLRTTHLARGEARRTFNVVRRVEPQPREGVL
jgi:hypothetical protein